MAMQTSLDWYYVVPLMVFLFVSMATGCPEGCQCVAQGTDSTFTSCIGSNLTSIPDTIPKNTRELYLDGNQISILGPNSFNGLDNLRTLVVSRCHIDSIEANAFAGLSNLAVLDLTHNNIRELQSYTFSGLSSLNRLQLQHNNLQVIHNFAFHGLNLTKLSLEYNPDLSEISQKAFYETRILDLYFYNASIKSNSLRALRNLAPSLRELHLLHNQHPLELAEDLFQGFTFIKLELNLNGIQDASFLKYLTADIISLEGNPTGPIDFSKYPKLLQVRSLRLSNTSFTDVNPNFFRGLTHLTKLYLDDNDIQTLPSGLVEMFDRLEILSLENNYLHCNCELKWFRQWLEDSQDVTRVIGPECATPVRGNILHFDENKFQCRLPELLDITSHVNVSETHPVSLICTAEGDPVPSVHWESPDGKVLKISKNSPHGRALLRNTAVLQLNSISTKDAGTYQCTAANAAGEVTAVSTVDVYRLVNSSPVSHLSCFAICFISAVHIVAALLLHS